jgi:hypothetical protein
LSTFLQSFKNGIKLCEQQVIKFAPKSYFGIITGTAVSQSLVGNPITD